MREISQPRARKKKTDTHKDGRWFRRCGPDTDTDPRRGDGPDKVATEEDDDKAEDVHGHDDGKPGPGMSNVVLRVLGGV